MKPKEIFAELGIIGLYFGAAVFFTWPLILNLQQAVLGYLGFENLTQTLWFYWLWKDRSLYLLQQLWNFKEFLILFFHFPVSVPMENFLDLFTLNLPLDLIFKFPAYYNVKVLLVLSLNAYSLHLLLRCLFPSSRYLAWLALPWTFNPYIFYNLATGRMTESILFFMPLYVMMLWRSFYDRAPAAPYWAGLWLALAGLTYWFYGMWLVGFSLIFALYFLADKRHKMPGYRWFGLSWLKLAGSFWLVVFFFVTPYLAMLLAGRPLPGAVKPPSFLYQLANDACSFEYLAGLTSKGIPLALAALAFVPLVWLRAKDSRLWLWTFALFYLGSLGTFLKFQDAIIRFKGKALLLPYPLLLKYVPLFNKLYWPSHFIAMVLLALTILAALNVEQLARRFKLKTLQLHLLFMGFTLVFYTQMAWAQALQLPVTRLQIPSFYRELKGGFIELPTNNYEGINFYHDIDLKLINFYQLFHQQNVLWGQKPPASELEYPIKHPALVQNNSFFQYLFNLSMGKPVQSFKPSDLKIFKDMGYKYIVVHERFCVHGLMRLGFDLKQGRQTFGQINDTLAKLLGAPSYYEESFWELPKATFKDSFSFSGFPSRGAYQQKYKVALFKL